jgi:hypothetical protein
MASRRAASRRRHSQLGVDAVIGFHDGFIVAEER